MPSKQQRRNGHAFHPIMKKGGAHGKNKKAQRKAAKHQLHKHLQEGLGRSFWRSVFNALIKPDFCLCLTILN